MSHRYYGGTRESSVERDLANIQWLQKHGSKKALRKLAAQDRIINISTLIIVGLFLFGVGALIVWGCKNLFESGFSLEFLLLNPITIIVLMVGLGVTSINRA